MPPPPPPPPPCTSQCVCRNDLSKAAVATGRPWSAVLSGLFVLAARNYTSRCRSSVRDVATEETLHQFTAWGPFVVTGDEQHDEDVLHMSTKSFSPLRISQGRTSPWASACLVFPI